MYQRFSPLGLKLRLAEIPSGAPPLGWCSTLPGSKQEEHPGRPCPLGPPIQAGIWEPLVPDHTPPKGLQRKSPAWAGGIRWRFEISG